MGGSLLKRGPVALQFVKVASAHDEPKFRWHHLPRGDWNLPAAYIHVIHSVHIQRTPLARQGSPLMVHPGQAHHGCGRPAKLNDKALPSQSLLTRHQSERGHPMPGLLGRALSARLLNPFSSTSMEGTVPRTLVSKDISRTSREVHEDDICKMYIHSLNTGNKSCRGTKFLI